MTQKPIDFWFTMGSTYTCLTVLRLSDIEQATGTRFRWRPFHLLTILQEMKHVPFADKPAKAAYMWRDIERRAAMYGIAVRVPAPYPASRSITANRVAILGLNEGWGVDFIRATYRRWFQLGQEMASEPNIVGSLSELGLPAERILEIAAGDQISSLLAAATDAGRDLGIFSSPTFSIGSELFWGDDRLDDAISWYHTGAVKQP